MSIERLIDEIWDGRPPLTARDALQNYVSQLRKTLGSDVISTRGSGYALEVDVEDVDIGRFDRLIEQSASVADPEERRMILQEALALWRGTPLADLDSSRLGTAEIRRLVELRVAATEESLDAQLALGRHQALVPTLEHLVAEYPLRERLRGQLMIALYRSGRQSEAPEAYRRLRELLAGELGLEPGIDLRRLEQAILRQDASLDRQTRLDEAGTTASGQSRTRPALALGGRLALLSIVLVLAGCGVAAVVFLWPDHPSSVRIADDSLGVFDTSGVLIGQAPVATIPSAITYGAGSAWISDFDRGTLARVDPVRLVVRQTIPVGAGPSGVAYGAGAVWVANRLDGTVARVDPQTQQVVQRIALGGAPAHLAVGDGAVWVTNSVDRDVVRLDALTGRRVAAIPLPFAASAVAVAAGAAPPGHPLLGRRISPAGRLQACGRARLPTPIGGQSVLHDTRRRSELPRASGSLRPLQGRRRRRQGLERHVPSRPSGCRVRDEARDAFRAGSSRKHTARSRIERHSRHRPVPRGQGANRGR